MVSAFVCQAVRRGLSHPHPGHDLQGPDVRRRHHIRRRDSIPHPFRPATLHKVLHLHRALQQADQGQTFKHEDRVDEGRW